VPNYLILRLVASGHFAGLDVKLPHGRLGWVAWRPKDASPVEYQGQPEGRLTLRLDSGYDAREGQWIAEVLSALLDLAHGPLGITLAVTEVTDAALEEGVVDAAVLAEQFDVLDERWADLGHGWWPTDDPIRDVVDALPAVLATSPDHDHGLPAALLYYKLSTAEFSFLGDSISWALSDEGRRPSESAYERQRVETAFHNAFKAIEALVGGEPNNDDRRFRGRLEAVGVDPDELVGFRGQTREALFDVLKRIRGTRDQRAAHAGRTGARRGISYYELMEAQYGAAAALGHAVLHVAPPRSR